jgi:hypothetical protein
MLRHPRYPSNGHLPNAFCSPKVDLSSLGRPLSRDRFQFLLTSLQYVVTLKGLGQRPSRMLHESEPTISRPSPKLKRAQKVENVLLLFCGELAEVLDHLFRFGIAAVVRLDRYHQVGGTPVVQEKEPLPEAP